MPPVGSSPRIALVIDEEEKLKPFARHFRPGTTVYHAVHGDELVALALAGRIDAAIVGVLNRHDAFLPLALRELRRAAPEVAIVGVFEPSRPSLDEAADLARDFAGMGFVRRPGARLQYLARRIVPGAPGLTLTPKLVGCLDQLPLAGAARYFALMQVLHPSYALGIPEQARELGSSRRNLERGFQGPDLCSPGSFQSACAAGEAAYLRLVRGLSDHEVASVVQMLTREGVENSLAVPRAIRNGLGLGLEDLRAGGVSGVVAAVLTAFRTSRDPERRPAQWEPDTRYAPGPGVLAVPLEDRLVLIDAGRGLRHPLDRFGEAAWSQVALGASFAKIAATLAAERREPLSLVRARLIVWLGELLVMRLIIRLPGRGEAANGG